jgi:hypothetical protein
MAQSHLLPLRSDPTVSSQSLTPTLLLEKGLFASLRSDYINDDWDRLELGLVPHFLIISIPISKSLYNDGSLTLPLGYSVTFGITTPESIGTDQDGTRIVIPPTTTTRALFGTIEANPPLPSSSIPTTGVSIEPLGNWDLTGLAMKLSGNYLNVHSFEQRFGYITNLYPLSRFKNESTRPGQIFLPKAGIDGCLDAVNCRIDNVVKFDGTTIIKWSELTHSAQRIDLTNDNQNTQIDHGYYYWTSEDLYVSVTQQGFDHRWGDKTGVEDTISFDQVRDTKGTYYDYMNQLERIHKIYPSYMRTDVWITQDDDTSSSIQQDDTSIQPPAGLRYTRIMSRLENLSVDAASVSRTAYPYRANWDEEGSYLDYPALLGAIIGFTLLGCVVLALIIFVILHFGCGFCKSKPIERQEGVEIGQQQQQQQQQQAASGNYGGYSQQQQQQQTPSEYGGYTL